MVLAWFPITSSWNTACYIRGLIHGIGRGVPNGLVHVSTNWKICMEDNICRYDFFCQLHLSIFTKSVFPRKKLLLSNQKMGDWSPM